MRHARSTAHRIHDAIERFSDGLTHGRRAAQLVVLTLVLIPTLAMAYLSTAPTADRNWYWQNQTPQGNDLRAMSWVGTQTAWAVGASGTALKTADGGQTWAVQDLNATSDFTGVSFVPASATGWVVGVSGQIHKTTNAGTLWVSQTAPSTASLRAVAAWSTAVAVAVGDAGSSTSTICYTGDGATWRSSSTTCTVSLSSVDMVSATTAWAVGANGEVLKTVNGGASWSWSQPTTSTAGLTGIAFDPTGQYGYFVGNAASSSWTIYKTTNSGATWTPVSIGGTGANLTGVDVLDANNAIVIGTGGLIRRTVNGGTTWTNESQNNGSNALRAVKLLSATSAYSIGDTGLMFYTRSSGTAYPSWFTLLPGSQAQWNAVDMVDANHGWAVGTNGAIMHTTDAGQTWQNQAGGVNGWEAVASISTTQAWAVGQNGWIARTVNGSDWTTQTTGTSQQLNGIRFTSALSGVAVGNSGTILRTTDGGATWTARASGTTQNLNALWFAANGTLGYAVGNAGAIVGTTNGGNTWSARAFANTTQNLLTVSGNSADNNTLNQSQLWVGGAGAFRYTTTGGNSAGSWTDLTASAGIAATNTVRTVSAISTSTVWVTADYGVVRKTLNGTLASPSWTTENAGVATSTLDTLSHIWGASFVDANTGFLVGDSGLVRRTLDGGATWDSLQHGTLSSLEDVSFPDSADGWAVGSAGTVLHTLDGGQTWTQQRPGTTSGLWGVSMVTSATGWAVGDNGTVRRTVNGGLQWSGQSPTANTVNLAAVAAGDASHAVIAGQGIVNYTTDGSTWTSASVPPTQPVTGLSMIGTANVWAVSTRLAGNNAVWHSADGGKTWAPQATTANANLWDVWFSDANTGYAVGDSGVILKTTNGGAAWVREPSPTSAALNTVRFTTTSNGWAAGAGGVLVSTVDGGNTWTLRQSGTSQTLNAVAFAGSSRGFAVGNNGVLLRNENTAPPTTTVALAPPSPSGANGWYAPAPPTLTLTSSATGATNYYSWTSAAGPFTAYPAPFPAIEGDQNLYFYSTDTSGNAGPVSSQAIKSDLTSPTAPASTGISLIGTSSATVTWTAGADSVSGVDHYDVFVNGSFNTSTTALAAALTGLTPNTLYTTITVQAVDVAGLRSAMTTPTLSVLTHSLDTAPYVTVLSSVPATPNGANNWYVTTPTVTLTSIPADAQSRTTWYSWNVAGSNVSGTGDPGDPWDAYSAPILPPVPGANILYFWTQDTAGSRAPEFVQSQPFLVDTQTPSAPSVLATATDYRSITASWTATPATPSGIDHYDVYLDGSLDSSVTSPAVSITGLSMQTTYTLNVRAVSSAGATSSLSTTATATTPAPPRPFAPWAVYAKAPNGAQVYLDWSAADNVAGAVTYHVWRSTPGSNPASLSVIATVTGGLQTCTYVDSGLASSTQYWYAVSTIDSRGESDLSTTTAYTSAITQRPQRVTDVVVTGVSTSAVFLQWAPSSDPAIAGYAVYRADSSLASTATTLTALTATSGWFDLNVRENSPYYYSIKAIDASGAASFPSLEVEGKSLLSVVTNFSPHEAGGVPNGCLCHASHTASGDDKLTRFPGSSSQTLCAGTCHTPDFSAAQFSDPLLKSKHPEASTVTSGTPFTCITCHVPLYTAGTPIANLMRTNSSTPCDVVTDTPAGNSFCYSCHGPGSTLPQGDMSSFEQSAHSTVPAPPTGANIQCDVCHESHSSRNDYLLKYESLEMCLQCHTASAVNPNEVDIYDMLAANDGVNTAHPLLPEDQVSGARMTCQNCHNPHTANETYPVVDPHNPSPSGKWAITGSDIAFCETCHNGQQLPTSQETTPWAGPVLGSNGATTAYDMAAYYPANVHGFSSASGSTTTTLYLRTDMGYKYGDVLQCSVCHEPHGATNSNGIKSDIKSASGDKTISGVVTVKMIGGGKDFRFLCATCHIWNSATHDAMAGTSTVMFPMNCAACHTHALGAATPPLF